METASKSNLKKYSKTSDWLEKSQPSKKATFVLIMYSKQANKAAAYISIGVGFQLRLFSSQSFFFFRF